MQKDKTFALIAIVLRATIKNRVCFAKYGQTNISGKYTLAFGKIAFFCIERFTLVKKLYVNRKNADQRQIAPYLDGAKFGIGKGQKVGSVGRERYPRAITLSTFL